MKLLLVINPQARSGRIRRLLYPIKQDFASRQINIDILETTHGGSATSQIAAYHLDGYDGVVAVGGDGTLFDVLNGLYKKDRELRPTLGVLPVGTGNAFSRDLGLNAGEWQKAVSIIANGHTRKIDVGRVTASDESFYFLNILALGFAVRAGQTALKLKRLGNTAYTFATLWQTLNLNTQTLKLEVDGKLMEQENLFIEIANTRYTGTHFLIAPEAIWDDGFLDLIVVRKVSRFRLLSLFPSIYSGGHIKYPEVSTIKARSIRILTPENSLLGPDGEFHGHTPAHIECLHQDLSIFAP